MPGAFFDTNIFLYADDASEPVRQAKAIALIADHQRALQAILSIQVMQEYYAAATWKLGITPEFAQRKVELMSRLRVVRLQEDDILTAISLHQLHSIAFWDALIIQAAQLSGAEILYSEDLQHGRTWGATTVVNPFRS